MSHPTKTGRLATWPPSYPEHDLQRQDVKHFAGRTGVDPLPFYRTKSDTRSLSFDCPGSLRTHAEYVGVRVWLPVLGPGTGSCGCRLRKLAPAFPHPLRRGRTTSPRRRTSSVAGSANVSRIPHSRSYPPVRVPETTMRSRARCSSRGGSTRRAAHAAAHRHSPSSAGFGQADKGCRVTRSGPHPQQQRKDHRLRRSGHTVTPGRTYFAYPFYGRSQSRPPARMLPETVRRLFQPCLPWMFAVSRSSPPALGVPLLEPSRITRSRCDRERIETGTM